MRIAILILLLGFGYVVAAQAYRDSTLVLSSDCRGIPYDEDDFFIIDSITLEGNKVTREHIILRELLFSIHDTICREYFPEAIIRSRENLLNTSLFNFVTIDTVPSGMHPNGVSVRLSFIERWYIWPLPIFELSDRNFNAWLEDMDLYRVSYGVNVNWENFRGRREKINLFLRFGYDQKFELLYTIPYIDERRRLGIGIGGGVAMNHEVSYQTENNKPVFYRDEAEYVRREGFSYLQFSYRKNYYNVHEFRVAYNYNRFDDSLLILNPGYSSNLNTTLNYFSLNYTYKSDHRDSKPYPLEGYYFDASFVKVGLGLLPENDLDYFYILSTFRKFWKLDKRIYYAFGLNSKFSSKGEQPYFKTWGLGYGRDFVRSYELYVIDGQSFGLFKNNFKFALLQPQVFNINFIPTEKFSKVHFAIYMNLFTDIGFVNNAYKVPGSGNTFENKLLVGYGVGLDFVTYYDVVIRLELSTNIERETGFFIHFQAPI